jgi:integrase
MATRRRFGNIRRLPSGRYQARYQDTARRTHTAPDTFHSERETDRWLGMIETDLIRGNWIDPKAGRRLFEDQVLTWRTSKTSLRPNTQELYAYLLQRFLLPFFMGMPLSDIGPDTVREWRVWALHQPQRRGNSTRGSGGQGATTEKLVSPTTVAKAYRLLHSIMDLAVDDEVLARNPCRIKGAGSEEPADLPDLTAAQVDAVARAIESRYSLLVLVSAYVGLRWGEAIALRRSAIDLTTSSLRVTEQVTQPGNGPPVVGPPKTAGSVRVCPIPYALVPKLEAHLAQHAQAGDSGLLFPAPDGGFLSRTNFRRRSWLPAPRPR